MEKDEEEYKKEILDTLKVLNRLETNMIKLNNNSIINDCLDLRNNYNMNDHMLDIARYSQIIFKDIYKSHNTIYKDFKIDRYGLKYKKRMGYGYTIRFGNGGRTPYTIRFGNGGRIPTTSTRDLAIMFEDILSYKEKILEATKGKLKIHYEMKDFIEILERLNKRFGNDIKNDTISIKLDKEFNYIHRRANKISKGNEIISGYNNQSYSPPLYIKQDEDSQNIYSYESSYADGVSLYLITLHKEEILEKFTQELEKHKIIEQAIKKEFEDRFGKKFVLHKILETT